jgi:chorismate mutase-like protein
VTEAALESLSPFRARLDEIDHEIIALLGQRLDIGRAVASHKASHGIAVMQHDRVQQVKDRAAGLAVEADLDADFVVRLYGVIIEEMCRVEDEIVDAG